MIRNAGRGKPGAPGVDGDDGVSPSNQDLETQMLQLIPALVASAVPTPAQVAALVAPGHTPTNGEITALITPLIPAPIAGLSAYQLAQSLGFAGTLSQWLDTIKGLPGYKFAKRLTTNSAGLLVVDLTSAAFGVGVVPVCSCVVEGATSTLRYTVHQVGVATPTSVTFFVGKFAALSINLLGLTTLNLFEASGAVVCSVTAHDPTP